MRIFGVFLMVIGGLWGLSGLWSLWTLVNRIADRGAGAQSTTAEGLTTVALVIVYILPGVLLSLGLAHSSHTSAGARSNGASSCARLRPITLDSGATDVLC
jgi:hypothetical protein